MRKEHIATHSTLRKNLLTCIDYESAADADDDLGGISMVDRPGYLSVDIYDYEKVSERQLCADAVGWVLFLPFITYSCIVYVTIDFHDWIDACL